MQAILAAPIDRLPVTEKQLVQTLAVIGKRFQLRLAAEVAGKSQQELIPALDKLQEREFIYEQPSQGDVEYEFKHALTQDVAYNSVLIERRKAQHERTAAAIESLYGANLDDHLSELTNHYGRSANTRKTVDYLWRSGRQAARRSAFNEGIRISYAWPGVASTTPGRFSAPRPRAKATEVSTGLLDTPGQPCVSGDPSPFRPARDW